MTKISFFRLGFRPYKNFRGFDGAVSHKKAVETRDIIVFTLAANVFLQISRNPEQDSMSVPKISASSLPVDLILEVFLRLPKKPLARAKCVSKGLLNLMDGQTFRKCYDTYHNSVCDFAVMSIEYRRLLLSMVFHLPDDLDSANVKEVNIPFNGNYSCFVDCCKGIVCLMVSPSIYFVSEPTDTLYLLFNPFNETFKQVVGWDRLPCYGDFTVGFGYDYATDDYKIVRFQPTGLCCVNEKIYIIVHHVYVYSMRRDSWSLVNVEFGSGYTHDVKGICVDGAIHWLWKEDLKVYSSIAAFDLETESARSIPLPNVEPGPNWMLKNLGGRLCVCVSSPDSSTIWVMEEYGIENSWTPLFNIDNSFQLVGYSPTWDNAPLLCFGLNSRSWLWLNTQDGSEKNIQIQKVPRPRNMTECFIESVICVRSPLRLGCSN